MHCLSSPHLALDSHRLPVVLTSVPLFRLSSLATISQDLFRYHLASKTEEFLKFSAFFPDVSSASHLAPLCRRAPVQNLWLPFRHCLVDFTKCTQHCSASGRSTLASTPAHLSAGIMTSFQTYLPLLALSLCLILRGSISRWNSLLSHMGPQWPLINVLHSPNSCWRIWGLGMANLGCQFDTSGKKKEPQLINCPHQIGLWSFS